ncbi:zinc dependent phospholipase C family protein [Hymenobacter sp. BT175]|uniref:zinc dependent phospholipase C family protein n=1 Tax=Hymenobacter translucens TaxID=2886507 RepID=UPI001D0ECB8F|nr:zinc dependent phospholipase C family protein [Hymenobacter translucens]MCC2547560.1 zinc dependent phospholipase C family protein [Hymenobacter translucens]
MTFTTRPFHRWLLAGALVLLAPTLLHAWGTWAHQRINRAAVLALPEPMRTFFFNHLDFVVQEAIVPDLRKYTLNDKAEFPRHFIDIEEFNTPLAEMPRTSTEAYAKFDAATLDKHGRLPWYIQDVMAKLTQAMKTGRKDDILFLAADLGHYLGDAHMPLHTSSNHDGQKTGQRGIHALWESQVPEQFGRPYNFNVGEAKLIADPVAETWRIISQSHAAADTLLSIDKKLRTETAAAQLYEVDAAGKPKKNVFNSNIHARAYAGSYHTALNHMVERQMRGAIRATANFWYTAWVNAGKPDLTKLDAEYTTRSNAKNLKAELKQLKKGQLVDMKTFPEFEGTTY